MAASYYKVERHKNQRRSSSQCESNFRTNCHLQKKTTVAASPWLIIRSRVANKNKDRYGGKAAMSASAIFCLVM